MLRFIASASVLIVVALLQSTTFFFIGAIKPNATLAVLLTLATIQSTWTARLLLLAIGALMMKVHPVDLQAIAFAFSALGGMVLINYLPWKTIVNIVIAVLIATVLLGLYNGVSLTALFAETLYNTVTSGAVYLLAKLCIKNSSTKR